MLNCMNPATEPLTLWSGRQPAVSLMAVGSDELQLSLSLLMKRTLVVSDR